MSVPLTMSVIKGIFVIHLDVLYQNDVLCTTDVHCGLD